MKLYGVVDALILDQAAVEKNSEELTKLFQRFSQQHKDIMRTRITAIDVNQWQFVLDDFKRIYIICQSLQKQLKLLGCKALFGIGIGTISTSVAEDSRLMDGQAFIAARESLDLLCLNCSSYRKVIPTKNSLFYVTISKEFNSTYCGIPLDGTINTLIQNNEVLVSKITDKQRKTIELYQQYGSYTEMIANDPALKKGTLSDKMNKSNYWMICKNEAMIERLLTSLNQTSCQGGDYAAQTIPNLNL